MPPDDPSVEVTFNVTTAEHEALGRLAEQLGIPEPTVLRQALATEVLMRGLIAEGGTILCKRQDGTVITIEF